MRTILNEDANNINLLVQAAIELYHDIGNLNSHKQMILFVAGFLLYRSGMVTESIVKMILTIVYGRKRMIELDVWRKIKSAYEQDPIKSKQWSDLYSDE